MKYIMIQVSKPIITKKDIQDVSEVLKSGMIVQGPKVKELEDKFVKYCKCTYAIAVNSGTAALHCALHAAGIKKGDEVITTPFTFVATANPISMQNAKIIFADIDKNTFNIDPFEIEKKITSKTKAIIPVSLYGLPYDEKINQIAKKYNLKIIDDACQAIGSKYNGLKTGNRADLSCFSLYATKNIMSAEGGIITTNNPEYAELCKRFRHHGQSEQTRYQYYDLGYNYRMTDIHAAIGSNQIDKIDEFTEKRIQNAVKLNEGLKNMSGIITPLIPKNTKHCFHQYTIQIKKNFPLSRDELKNYLTKNEIGAAVYYPKPLHLHPHFQKIGYKKNDFPIAEKIASQVLSLPVHPSLSNEDIELIIKIFHSYDKKIKSRSHRSWQHGEKPCKDVQKSR
ncbi:DegT/DnrJ/EryC1/StrS family aminotransferase [Patescibacteria group bacterium]